LVERASACFGAGPSKMRKTNGAVCVSAVTRSESSSLGAHMPKTLRDGESSAPT
jgi:hypothetical protein